jgi:hypothetical protein
MDSVSHVVQRKGDADNEDIEGQESKGKLSGAGAPSLLECGVFVLPRAIAVTLAVAIGGQIN